MSDQENYTHLSLREHILTRPDSYIGSIQAHTEKLTVCSSDDVFEEKTVTYNPGLYKIFDEILVNAADNFQRHPPLKKIEVEINEKKNYIRVSNDGKGISCKDVYDKEDDRYYPTPHFIFGILLTSSNYDDEKGRVTGGRNGYGAKLANIYSTKFVIDIINAEEGTEYHQTFTNNMLEASEPVISQTNKKSSSTSITFYPDLKRFKLDKLSDDILGIIRRRVYDIAGIMPSVNVYLNEKKIEIKKWDDYCRMYLKPDTDFVSTEIEGDVNGKRYKWKIGVAPSKGLAFKQVSFVNCVATKDGGNHVDVIVSQICDYVKEQLKKGKQKVQKVTTQRIKNFLHVFVDSLVINPAFSSQTKDKLTISESEQKVLRKAFVVPEKFLENLKKKTTILSDIKDDVIASEAKAFNKVRGKKSGRVIIQKLEDANEAGKARSSDCTLILTEGDSAKSLAVTGLSVVGRDLFGVFPLKGKLLNVRDCKKARVQENEEIQNLFKIMGLDPTESYESGIEKLRYGHIMIMADQDVDGSHIKGLIINFIQHFWPALFKRKGFIQEFITPIVKCTRANTVESFFTIPQFVEWKRNNNNGKGWKIKYYKGLATSTPKEAKEYFSDFNKHKIEFVSKNEDDSMKIDLAFNKKRADDRKIWLSTLNIEQTYLGQDKPTIQYSEFIDKELILFSNYANIRSIPSVIDGLKPGQRKILWVCLKNNINREIKVSQLSGKVSMESAYHHGEESLNQTIVGMAQDFVGSNNINLLEPIGAFGTRLSGGDDYGASRYIYTRLSKITRSIFVADDDNLLSYQAEEGQQIEPSYYVPIIPMVLVNGSNGIGVGWSSNVPQFNPIDIINNMRKKINNEEYEEMIPWYSGFVGEIIPEYPKSESERKLAHRWITKGIATIIDDTTIEISELPILRWTNEYKNFLENLILGIRGRKEQTSETSKKKKDDDSKEDTQEEKKEKKKKVVDKDSDKVRPFITDFKNHSSNITVSFVINVTEEQMEYIKHVGLEEFFALSKSINSTNMTLFNLHGRIHKYGNVYEIMDDFFEVRHALYVDRRQNIIDNIQLDLKRLSNQARFIKMVIEKKLEVSGVPRRDVLLALKLHEFDLYDKNTVKSKIRVSEEAIETDQEDEEEDTGEKQKVQEADHDLAELEKGYDYLLSMKIWYLTRERYEALLKEKGDQEALLAQILATTVEQMWLNDLDSLENVYRAFERAKEKTFEATREQVARIKSASSAPARRRPTVKKKKVESSSSGSDDFDDFVKREISKTAPSKGELKSKVKQSAKSDSTKAARKPSSTKETSKSKPTKGSTPFDDDSSSEEDRPTETPKPAKKAASKKKILDSDLEDDEPTVTKAPKKATPKKKKLDSDLEDDESASTKPAKRAASKKRKLDLDSDEDESTAATEPKKRAASIKKLDLDSEDPESSDSESADYD